MKKLCIILFLLAVLLSVPLSVLAEAPEGEVLEGEPTTEQAQTVSEKIAEWIGENLTVLFSGATLAGSLLLSWLYKRGFLPSLSAGLSSMSTSMEQGLGKIQKLTNDFSDSASGTLKDFAEKIEPALEKASQAATIAEKVAQSTAQLQEQLDRSNTDREAMKLIMQQQASMFYEFFMAVNLPQHQKDKLGQTYVDMQKTIAAISGEPKAVISE